MAKINFFHFSIDQSARNWADRRSPLLYFMLFLSDGKSLLYASIPGEAFVKEALDIGVGGEIDAEAGALVDNRYAPPIRLKGTITAIEQVNIDAKTEVVVQCDNVQVIVTEKRKGYHSEKDFTHLGLNSRESDILVVKNGYLEPELYEMRANWIMALTPGGVDQDLFRLDDTRINRPIFLLDTDMENPVHSRFE